MLYTAGTGGEFLTSTLTQCVDELNTIPITKINNHWSAVCKVAYSEIGIADQNYHTDDYLGTTDKPYDMYKDHYQKPIKEYWPSDMTVICLEMSKDYEYWATLCYKKLSTYITINKDKFIQDQISALEYDYNNIQTYTNMFEKSYVVNIDEMHKKIIGERFLDIFPSLDLEKFKYKQFNWIEKNYEL